MLEYWFTLYIITSTKLHLFTDQNTLLKHYFTCSIDFTGPLDVNKNNHLVMGRLIHHHKTTTNSRNNFEERKSMWEALTAVINSLLSTTPSGDGKSLKTKLATSTAPVTRPGKQLSEATPSGATNCCKPFLNINIRGNKYECRKIKYL